MATNSNSRSRRNADAGSTDVLDTPAAPSADATPDAPPASDATPEPEVDEIEDLEAQIAALTADRDAKLQARREAEFAAIMGPVSEALALAHAASLAGKPEDALAQMDAARTAINDNREALGLTVVIPARRQRSSGSASGTPRPARTSRVRDDILRVNQANPDHGNDWSAREMSDAMADMDIFAPSGNQVSTGAIEVAFNGNDWRNGNIAGMVGAGLARVSQERDPRRWVIVTQAV